MVRAMPARQLLAFLTDADLRALVEGIAAQEPGLIVSQGRYLRGDPRALLEDPDSLERRESLPGERRLYLLHRKHCADVVVHPQPKGPFAGWSQIDEEKTDCIVVRLKDSPPFELEPARIYAHVTYWRAADKARKRPMFSVWAGQLFKWIGARLPASASSRSLRVGADAQAKARAGELRLKYLYRTIAP